MAAPRPERTEQPRSKARDQTPATPVPPTGRAVTPAGRSNQEAQRRAAGPLGRFAADPGPGARLPPSVEEALRPSLGPSVSAVRVHSDAVAAAATRQAGARALTVGDDIAFAPGQFSPTARAGRALLRHELAHVVQQRAMPPSPGPLTVGAEHDAFERAADGEGPTPPAARPPTVQRQPADAGVPDAGGGSADAGVGPSDAGAVRAVPLPGSVEINGTIVPADDPGQQRLLSEMVHRGGIGAAYSFADSMHTAVRQIADDIAAARRLADQVDAGYRPAGGVPWNDQMFAERQTEHDRLARAADGFDHQIEALQARLSTFQQLVRDASIVRLEANRNALAQWKDYLHSQLTPGQLRRQVDVENQRSAIVAASTGPRAGIQLSALQRQSTMTHTRERAVEDRVARGLIRGGCEYCHEMQHAINFEYAHPEFDTTTLSPRQLFDWYALGEAANPTPLPSFMDAPPQTGLEPAAVSGYPGVAAELRAIQSIRPVLRQLGPDGFKVIDASMTFEGLSDEQLLLALDFAIELRRINFALFERRIEEPGFDYLILRPVLRELLPLADPDVQTLVEQSLARAQRDAEVMSTIIGWASVAALLLTIFPPTALIGLALDVGLATYGVVSGFEQFQQGRLLSLGIGSDVLDAQQQEAAHALMSMGALTIVMSSLGIVMGGLGAVRMIRSGTGATAILEGVEGEAAGNRITVSRLNSSNPRAVVVNPEGAVIIDESLTELGLLEGPGVAGPAGPRQNVLVVGAETEAEFAYASEVSRAGQPVTVVNPRATAQSEAFVARGGTFLHAGIEEMPATPSYTMIREDFPFPLGRVLAASEEFAAARITRLAPGGRWVVVTEQGEFATTLEVAATRQGARVSVRPIPAAHEGAPVSAWPREHERFVLIIEKQRVPVPPSTPPPISEPPVTVPPVTEPPVSLPLVSEPPVTVPPVTEPPASSAPISEPPTSTPAMSAGDRLPPDFVDAAIDALDADNPFTVDIGQRRAQQIQSGARDFALDRPVGFDVDEPLPVGAPDISPARAVQRAMDPHNRQLLDPATNQLTKYLGMSQETVARSRMSLVPVSVVDHPDAIFTRRFDEVTELAQVFDEAVERVHNIRSLGPTAIKGRINANMRQIIGEGLTPAGARVRDALRRLGYEYVPGRGIVAVRSVVPPPGTAASTPPPVTEPPVPTPPVTEPRVPTPPVTEPPVPTPPVTEPPVTLPPFTEPPASPPAMSVRRPPPP